MKRGGKITAGGNDGAAGRAAIGRLYRSRPRPFLCRIGIHRWGPYNTRPSDWRIVEKTCRRCRAQKRMSMKPVMLRPPRWFGRRNRS